MVGISKPDVMTPLPRNAFEGKAPQSRPQNRVDRRSDAAAKVVGREYCRLQMPRKLALAVRETVSGHRLGNRGRYLPPLPMHPLHSIVT